MLKERGKNYATKRGAMRTTLINTNFWDEQEIDKLHLDSKLLYFYMLTNPKKGLANVYPFKSKVISAYTGLSVEQIDIAAGQLIQLGYVAYYKNYYILLKGHEMPKKGRFTEQTMEKERALVPAEVLDYFDNLPDTAEQNSSGVAPEHNNKDKDKDNNKNKDIKKDKEANKEAEAIANELADKILENYSFKKITEKHINTWSDDIEKLNRLDGYEYDLIRATMIWSQQDDFWKQNIQSGSKLRDKFETLLVRIKTEQESQPIFINLSEDSNGPNY